MRGITKEMIDNFNMKELGYDFMGYTFSDINDLSFHHLIVPKRLSQKEGIGDGYVYWNGAILRQNTSHNYLHTIERIDRDIFMLITERIIQEKKLGYLSIDELKQIREILLYFEKENKDKRTKKGEPIIKQKYISGRIEL